MNHPSTTTDATPSAPAAAPRPDAPGFDRDELTATAVLLMMPRLARTPVAVLIDQSVPSSLRLEVFSGRDVFVRLRKGPSVHGLGEPYRELTADEYPVESGAVAVVGFDRYVQARFACSASVFGAADTVAFVPRDGYGRAYRRVRVPVPSLDRPSWHEFELVSRTRMECRYRVAQQRGAVPTGGSRALSAL